MVFRDLYIFDFEEISERLKCFEFQKINMFIFVELLQGHDS